jgi:hypothetical protein
MSSCFFSVDIGRSIIIISYRSKEMKVKRSEEQL